jgi:hypothetical protein
MPLEHAAERVLAHVHEAEGQLRSGRDDLRGGRLSFHLSHRQPLARRGTPRDSSMRVAGHASAEHGKSRRWTRQCEWGKTPSAKEERP